MAAASSRPKTGADKRRHERHAHRIPCELFVRGTRHTGIVKDISSSGLFVQTRARPSPGTVLTVVFPAAPGRTEIRVAGRVARSDRVQAHLALQGSGGLGIEVPLGTLGRLLGELLRAKQSPAKGSAQG